MEDLVIKANPQMWLALYGEVLYQYCLPRVKSSEIAEDLVQETFFAALKSIEGFKLEASEKNWLFAILKNKIIDHYRKMSKEQHIISIPDLKFIEDDCFNAEGFWNETTAPKNWQAADTDIERKELQHMINWCKDHLKNLQQNVFTLKYMEELDSEEICKVLNISPSNYWVLIHRAKLQMRSCIEKKWLKN